MKGLELELEKRRLCGELSPASALAILQKTPPTMVLTHDQTQATATIYSLFAGINFLERYYVKSRENAADPQWIDRK